MLAELFGGVDGDSADPSLMAQRWAAEQMQQREENMEKEVQLNRGIAKRLAVELRKQADAAAEAKEECAVLQSDLASIRNDAAEARAACAALQGEVVSLRCAADSLTRDAAQRSQEMDALRALAPQLEVAKEELDGQRAALVRQRDAHVHLLGVSQKLSQQNNVLAAEVERMGELVPEVEQENKALKARLAYFDGWLEEREKLIGLSQAYQRLTEETEVLRAKAQHVDDLRAQKAALEAACKKLSAEVQPLNEEVRVMCAVQGHPTVEDTLHRLVVEHKRTMEEQAQVQSTHEARERDRQYLEDERRATRAVEQECHKLTLALAEMRRDLEDARSETVRNAAERDAHRLERDEVREALRMCREAHTELQARCEAVCAAEEKSVQRERDSHMRVASARRLEDDAKTLTDAAMQQALSAIGREEDVAAREQDVLRRREDMLRREDDVQRQERDLHTTIADIARREELTRRREDDLRAREDAMSSREASHELSTEARCRELAAAREEVDEIRRAHSAVQRLNDELQAALSDAERRVAEADAARRQTQERETAAKTEIAVLETRAASLEQQMDSQITTILNPLSAECDRLRRTVEDTKVAQGVELQRWQDEKAALTAAYDAERAAHEATRAAQDADRVAHEGAMVRQHEDYEKATAELTAGFSAQLEDLQREARAQLDNLQREMGLKEAELVEADATLGKEREEYMLQLAEKQALLDAIEKEAGRERDILKTMVQETGKQLLEERGRVVALQSDVEAKNVELECADEEMKRLRHELANTTAKLSATQAKLEDTQRAAMKTETELKVKADGLERLLQRTTSPQRSMRAPSSSSAAVLGPQPAPVADNRSTSPWCDHTATHVHVADAAPATTARMARRQLEQRQGAAHVRDVSPAFPRNPPRAQPRTSPQPPATNACLSAAPHPEEIAILRRYMASQAPDAIAQAAAEADALGYHHAGYWSESDCRRARVWMA